MLVLSELEYASFVWNPDQAYLITKLESLQNRAAQFIGRDYSLLTSVTSLKTSIGLNTLQGPTKGPTYDSFMSCIIGNHNFKLNT